jgi:CopG antitoxin of type II toxin-antitoxin system
MKEIQTPQFANYEEEAAFWDNFDTSEYMSEDEWLEIETDTKRPIRVTILPDIAAKLTHRATSQGVTIETLVNVLLADIVREPLPVT